MRKGESNTQWVRAPEDLTACPRFRIFLIPNGTSGMPAEGDDIVIKTVCGNFFTIIKSKKNRPVIRR